MEPIMWNELASSKIDLHSLEFRKVLCEGDFDEGKSVYIGPRSRSISGVTENGYYVISPLIPRTSDLNRYSFWELQIYVFISWDKNKNYNFLFYCFIINYRYLLVLYFSVYFACYMLHRYVALMGDLMLLIVLYGRLSSFLVLWSEITLWIYVER